VGGDPQVPDRDRDAPADVIAGITGLLLAGGGDVDPALYGERRHPAFEPAEPGRDAYEIELVERALDQDVPILAICRGVQLLNVALGGTLIQDVRSEVRQALEHDLAVPPHLPFELAHVVDVTAGTELAQVLSEPLRRGPLLVNSRHHQAIRRLGAGLVVTASAPDGVIEAVEDPNHSFLIGVQWHPENFWRTGEFAALFEAFVRAAHANR
jgi:putative glutamine amidotransferase